MASREFDASAIITGEDGDECRVMQVQDVNISGLSDDFHMDVFHAAAPVFSSPIDDDSQSASSPEAKVSRKKKKLVAVPEIDSDGNADDESWWPFPSSIQALWEQITASDHCNCLAGTVWNVHASNDKADQTHQVKTVNEIAEAPNVSAPLTMDKSTSFVIATENGVPVTPRTPLQQKLASTPVDSYTAVGTKVSSSRKKNYVSPMRMDYLEGNACRSVVTPLIGEHLVSTPLQGEDCYEAKSHLLYEDVSKASSRLFGEDIFDSQQVEQYCPSPPHLLPKMEQKDMLFVQSQERVKSAENAIFEVSTPRSQEGTALGMGRYRLNKDKYMKRVKDRRRQRKNDRM